MDTTKIPQYLRQRIGTAKQVERQAYRKPYRRRPLGWNPPVPFDFDPDACWLWTGPTREGYGVAYMGVHFGHEKRQLAHREVYELLVRPLESWEVLDHVCPGGPNKLCVNPRHVEPKTQSEHMKRHNPRKEDLLCPQGHEQERNAKGILVCRKCRYLAVKRWRERNPDKARALDNRTKRQWRAKRKASQPVANGSD